MSKVRVEKQIGDSVLSFETGWLAKQSAGCVLCQYRDTIVLNAVTTGAPRPGTDFFPLTCDYRERTSAAGKFPGGFLKREGRPTIKETLTSRLIDRPIRPMFAEGFMDEVQCQAMVLSSDRQTDGDILAMNGVSAALLCSPLPFEEAVASVRVARIDGVFISFPTHDQLEESELDLIVSGTKASVTMIEGFAREMTEDTMAEAIEYAHGVICQILELMHELAQKFPVAKTPFVPPANDGLGDRLKDKFYNQLKAAKQTQGKQARADAVAKAKQAALADLIPDPNADNAFTVASFERNWHALTEKVVRDLILSGTRPDGRDTKTLRNIECFTGVLPRVHGSAVFQRGETQALVTVTLGTARDEQRVDGLQDEYSKKFMLDYNFPAFSVGECKPNRGPGRREIGHGMLAERSVKPVLPDTEEFPYTVRIISDILESNGSSSMASVCGATLGLMDAGVKIKNPVAGISVGLVQESASKWTLLTDIIGDEDHYGDMDFKVAGTPNGITGIQLDLKIRGITFDIIRASLTQSREARMEILKVMLSTIRQPKDDISPYAPRMVTTQIDPEKIGLLIGPGGKNIRAIQEETQTVIEIEDSGRVMIAGTDQAMTDKA
ncbi:MAG: polyribonucleotide nucleotidyltransferase, partial [Pirellulaceae bacterium]